MSAFQDMVAADRDSVFINLDEFGTTHDIDGTSVNAVLQNERIEDHDEVQALSKSVMTIYAKTEDLNGRKMQGETIYIDDVGYTVQSWLEEMGITVVEATLPESW